MTNPFKVLRHGLLRLKAERARRDAETNRWVIRLTDRQYSDLLVLLTDHVKT